jgi:hypothetical protein
VVVGLDGKYRLFGASALWLLGSMGSIDCLAHRHFARGCMKLPAVPDREQCSSMGSGAAFGCSNKFLIPKTGMAEQD